MNKMNNSHTLKASASSMVVLYLAKQTYWSMVFSPGNTPSEISICTSTSLSLSGHFWPSKLLVCISPITHIIIGLKEMSEARLCFPFDA